MRGAVLVALAACSASPAPPSSSASALELEPEPEPAWRTAPLPAGAFVVIDRELIAQVVNAHDDVVDVTFPSEITKDHCTTLAPLGPPTDTTWTVPRKALTPVLAKPLLHRWPDGTAAALAPGLSLLSDGRHVRYPLVIDQVDVPVPADHVGLAYTPTPAPDVEVAHAGGPAQHDATVGGHSIQIYTQPDQELGSLVAIHRTCGKIVAKLGPANPGGLGGLGEAWSVVPAGTALTKADGTPLGTLRGDWNLPAHTLGPTPSGPTCLKQPPPYAPSVCAPTAAIGRGRKPYPLGHILY